MNFNGTESARLSPNFGSRVTWAPDGTRLAYLAQGSIWLIDIDGSNQIRIAERASAPAWSPDGSMIATVRAGEIVLLDTTGSELTRLGPAEDESLPRWSPDGSTLVFAWTALGQAHPWQIWSVDVETNERKQLTDISPDCGAPAYRSDGAEIIFHCPRVVDEFMWRMNADGSEPRQLEGVPGPGVAHGDWFTPS